MYIKELIGRYPELSAREADIRNAFEAIKNSYENGGKLILCGNGGSCADCDHICGEMLKSFVKKRVVPKTFIEKLSAIDEETAAYLSDKLQGSLPAISLCNQNALMTASLNDVDGNAMFAQQVMGYAKANDVLMCLSTSGNSKNVIYAAAVAKAKGAKIVGLLGKDGGRLKALCDVSIVVPGTETYKIQELHLPIYHALCLQIEEYFFAE